MYFKVSTSPSVQKKSVYLFLVFFIIACSGPSKDKAVKAHTQQQDSLLLKYDTKHADKAVDAFMQRLHTKSGFNGNVLIAKKGKIIYENSFGWADYLRKKPLTIDDQFELASVSKTLTSTAILLLVEEGKLKLDQDLRDFFPNFPWHGITVKQLLSHRSGLINYIYFSEDFWPNKQKRMSNMDAVGLLTKYTPAPYAIPDQRFHYNNTNYMLLGAIVEKVSNQTFSVFMQEQLFKPLGMKHTAVYSSADYEKIPTKVIGHDKVWARSVVQNYQDGPVGDKGIYSTVKDLYLFDRALKENSILSRASQDSAYFPRNPMIHQVYSYGYGWRLFKKGKQHVVYHTGWWHGFKGLFVRDLKNDITLIFVSNLANNSLTHLDELYHILDMPVIRQSAYDNKGNYIGGGNDD